MPERVLYQEWRHANDATKYPFSDRATLTNAAGKVIPEGLFLDAALYPVGAAAGLFLSQVDITHSEATIWVGLTSNRLMASGTFSLLDNDGKITLTDANGRPAGLLVSEAQRLAVLASWGVGSHEFTRIQTEFAATVHFPVPAKGVSGIRIGATGPILTGDVWIVGSNGVVLRPDTGNEGERIMRLDVVGDPLFRRRLCDPEALFQTPRFITRVRVVGANQSFECTPDELGNIQLAVANGLATDTVLRLTPVREGIRIGAVGSPPET